MTESCFCAIEPLLGTRTACRAVGRARASHYRRRHQTTPRHRRPRPAPPNKLSTAEVTAVLDALRSPRFVDCAPAQVLYTLLDEGIYLASESTYYRLLRAHGEVRERRRQATHPAKVKPELMAAAPNIVWTWDITKLKGPGVASTTTSTWCSTSSAATSSRGAWRRRSPVSWPRS